MVDLNEFKMAVYEEFLQEQEELELNEILKENQKLINCVSALKEWCEFEETANNLNEDDKDSLTKLLSAQSSNLKDMFKSGMDFAKSNIYNPTPTKVEFKTLTNTKFPDNIILFITSIGSWIKNVILKLLDMITRSIRRLFGLSNTEKDDITLDNLRLNFNKAKEIEQKHMINFDSDKATLKLDVENEKDMELVKNYLTSASNIYGTLKEDTNDVNSKMDKKNGNNRDNDGYAMNNKNAWFNDVTVTQIDVSRDLFSLKEALQHFFSLFDNSIGSNDEMLFGTGDLQIFLDAFNRAYKSIKGGEDDYFAIDGKVRSTDMLSADKIKDNLIRTKINTDKLRAAYVDTQNIIKSIMQQISAKQYIASSTVGINWKLMSSATFKQIDDIIKILKSREKQAVKLEKKMEKMQKVYSKLISGLEQQRGLYMQLSVDTTFSSLAQKRVSDLFDAGKYMMQTIMLRLSTLAVYIKCVKDTKMTLVALNDINRPNKYYLSRVVSKTRF